MEIILIRHGDPDYANDTLTAKGHEEAAALAVSLGGEAIDRVYTSPMGRARATAAPTVERLGLEPVILPWLHELNGCYDGVHWCWSLPGAVGLDLPAVPQEANWHTLPPYGAHMKPIQAELARQFDALLATHGYQRDGLRYRIAPGSDETIAVFCHAGLILTLLGHLFHWPLQLVYAHLSYDPTGVTRLRWEHHEDTGFAVPRAKTINDLSHLR